MSHEVPATALDPEVQAVIEGPLAPDFEELQRDLGHQPPGHGSLRVGTCQFAVSSDIRRNARNIMSQIELAANAGARVVHFPEAALSGYLTRDRTSWEGFDWGLLQERSERICAAAREHEVWVLLGSAHPLSQGRLPHNSVFVINDRGELVDHYDKRFCTTPDLGFYTPGEHRVAFEIDGVRCGVAICFDVRFPEIYREYKSVGVQGADQGSGGRAGGGSQAARRRSPGSGGERWRSWTLMLRNYLIFCQNDSL